jgi:hypothetical protein
MHAGLGGGGGVMSLQYTHLELRALRRKRRSFGGYVPECWEARHQLLH